MKRKTREPVWLNKEDLAALYGAVEKLNRVQATHDVRVDGALWLGDRRVGDTFYYAGQESYVIEWAS